MDGPYRFVVSAAGAGIWSVACFETRETPSVANGGVAPDGEVPAHSLLEPRFLSDVSVRVVQLRRGLEVFTTVVVTQHQPRQAEMFEEPCGVDARDGARVGLAGNHVRLGRPLCGAGRTDEPLTRFVFPRSGMGQLGSNTRTDRQRRAHDATDFHGFAPITD